MKAAIRNVVFITSVALAVIAGATILIALLDSLLDFPTLREEGKARVHSQMYEPLHEYQMKGHSITEWRTPDGLHCVMYSGYKAYALDCEVVP